MTPFYADDLISVFNCHCLEFLQAMEGEACDAIITDPPYGIDFQSNMRVATPKFKRIEGDKNPPLSILSEFYRVLKPDSACYIFTRWDVQQMWIEEMRKVGFEVKHVLVWDKIVHGMGDLDGDWGDETEFIIYAVKGRHILNQPRPMSPIRAQKIHPANIIQPAEKPVGVWHPMIRASSKPGDIILDPYAGSCSCLLAARQLSRRAIGCEIDLSYLEKVSPRLNQAELFRL